MAKELFCLKEFLRKCTNPSGRRAVRVVRLTKKSEPEKKPLYKLRVKTNAGLFTYCAKECEKTQRLIEKLKQLCEVECVERFAHPTKEW